MRHFRWLTAALVASTALVGLALADKSDAEPTPARASAVFEQIATANSLIGYSREAKSPEGLLAAVDLLRRSPTEPFAGTIEGDKNDSKPPTQAEELRGLLDEAKKLRPEDPHVAALADRIAGQLGDSPRGIVGGTPRQVVITLAKGQTRSVTFSFDPVDALLTGRNTGSQIRVQFFDTGLKRVIRTASISAGANFTLRERVTARRTFRFDFTNTGLASTNVVVTVQ